MFSSSLPPFVCTGTYVLCMFHKVVSNTNEQHDGCLIRGRNCLPFVSTRVYLRVFGGVRVAHLFTLCVNVCPNLSLRSHQNEIRFLFTSSCLTEGSCHLRYLCLFVYSDIQHILCCVFVLFAFVLCTLCY